MGDEEVLATRGRRPGRKGKGRIAAFIYAIRRVIPQLVEALRQAKHIYRGTRKDKPGYDMLIPAADHLLNTMEKMGIDPPPDDQDKILLYKTEDGHYFTPDQLRYLDGMTDEEREEYRKAGGFVPTGASGRCRMAVTMEDDQVEKQLAIYEAMMMDGWEPDEGTKVLITMLRKRTQARFLEGVEEDD